MEKKDACVEQSTYDFLQTTRREKRKKIRWLQQFRTTDVARWAIERNSAKQGFVGCKPYNISAVSMEQTLLNECFHWYTPYFNFSVLPVWMLCKKKLGLNNQSIRILNRITESYNGLKCKITVSLHSAFSVVCWLKLVASVFNNH